MVTPKINGYFCFKPFLVCYHVYFWCFQQNLKFRFKPRSCSTYEVDTNLILVNFFQEKKHTDVNIIDNMIDS